VIFTDICPNIDIIDLTVNRSTTTAGSFIRLRNTLCKNIAHFRQGKNCTTERSSPNRTIMGGAPRWMLIPWCVSIALNTLVAVVGLIFVNFFRNKPIVAMGQPPMLSIICLGTLLYTAGDVVLMAASFVTGLTSQALDRLCSCSEWLHFMGVVTTLTILLCKLYRAHKVVQFRRGQIILARHFFGPFVLSIFLSVGILTASQILSPKEHFIFQYGDDPETMVTFAYCWKCSVGLSIVLYFYWIKSFVIWLLQIGILAFAWKLRKVNEDIGDARRILWWGILNTINTAVAHILDAVFCYSFEDLDEMQKLVGSLFVWRIHNIFYVVSTVGFLIFPRMYYVYYEKVHGNLPEHVQLYGAGRVHVSLPTRTTRPT